MAMCDLCGDQTARWVDLGRENDYPNVVCHECGYRIAAALGFNRPDEDRVDKDNMRLIAADLLYENGFYEVAADLRASALLPVIEPPSMIV